jgi:hypothetical protein
MLMIDPGEENVYKWAIVSEAQGQKFGVSGPALGQVLLAVDAALVRGERAIHRSRHPPLPSSIMDPAKRTTMLFQISSEEQRRIHCRLRCCSSSLDPHQTNGIADT